MQIVAEGRVCPVLAKERVDGVLWAYGEEKGGSFEPDFLERQEHSYETLTSRQKGFGKEATGSTLLWVFPTTLGGAIGGSRIALPDDDELGGREEGWRKEKRTGDKQSAVQGILPRPQPLAGMGD